jgi:hypothetical protein
MADQLPFSLTTSVLESILKKPLHQAPIRLQRMLLELHDYVTLVYRKGTLMHLADTLSRAYLTNEQSSTFTEEVEIINMCEHGYVSKPIGQI